MNMIMYIYIYSYVHNFVFSKQLWIVDSRKPGVSFSFGLFLSHKNEYKRSRDPPIFPL